MHSNFVYPGEKQQVHEEPVLNDVDLLLTSVKLSGKKTPQNLCRIFDVFLKLVALKEVLFHKLSTCNLNIVKNEREC